MKKAILFPFLFTLFTSLLFAQEKEVPTASEEDLQWFREAKFGLFIHWGPVSLKGTEIGWSRGGERRFPESEGTEIPAEVYDKLYKEFNPTEFEPKEWVKIAQSAGMKYLVFTTKHHDGFCMFDSEHTDYKITNAPYGEDITKQLAEACHEAGLRLGFYYSPPDWHHSDYFTENHKRYVEYMHAQVEELCTHYGNLSLLWFDGLGGKPEDWGSYELIPKIRQWQPGILINNRAGLPQDFDTPEQRVGQFQNERPWESCITIGQQWAWKPDDHVKSLQQCIQTLVRCVGGDGNLLLNVGPKPNGKIEARQVERLREIGDWLDQYGKTIYGTRGGPFKPGLWGCSTYKDHFIYLHILDWDENETLTFPSLPARIKKASALTGGEVTVQTLKKGLAISLPQDDHDPIDTIIELQLDRPASEIPVMKVSLYTSLASGKKGRASNVYQNSHWNYGPQQAFDDDPDTRWATDEGITEAWLEVDLGEPKTFSRSILREAFDRVQEFTLERKVDGEWESFYRGKKIGDRKEIQFEPITAQVVRLHITNTVPGPTIREWLIMKE